MNSLDSAGSHFLRPIFSHMRELGLNQSALARRMKVSRTYVSKVLTGNDVNISFMTACRFAKALGMVFIPGMAEHQDDNASPSTSISNLNISLSLPLLSTYS